jgi:hypothetical protein
MISVLEAEDDEELDSDEATEAEELAEVLTRVIASSGWTSGAAGRTAGLIAFGTAGRSAAEDGAVISDEGTE